MKTKWWGVRPDVWLNSKVSKNCLPIATKVGNNIRTYDVLIYFYMKTNQTFSIRYTATDISCVVQAQEYPVDNFKTTIHRSGGG